MRQISAENVELNTLSAAPSEPPIEIQDAVPWLERVLPRAMRRLLDSDDLEMPLLQLPLAQLRLAHALYSEGEETDTFLEGETMGQLSARLAVKHNALTQAADRLIQRGLAERLPDPQDRRVVRLRLTETGQEWVRTRRARRRAHLEQLWTLLQPQERDELIQAVRVLEAVSHRLSAPETGR